MRGRRSPKHTASSNGVSEIKLKKVTEVEAEDMISKGVRDIKEEDVKEVLHRSEEIKKKFEMPGPLGRFVEDFKLLVSILKDYWSGEYRQVPFWTISAIVFAFLYILNPMDLIPDFIPGVGFVDDAMVIASCIALIEKDLEKYREWKNGESV